jgi:hypothetical protein
MPRTIWRAPGKFLKGPIPWAWLDRAGRLRGQALAVALVLHQRAGMKRSPSFRFNQSSTTDLGLNVSSIRRGITELERAGLIKVERKPGRGLDVTIIRDSAAPCLGECGPHAGASSLPDGCASRVDG